MTRALESARSLLVTLTLELRMALLVLLLEALKWGPKNAVPPEVFNAICAAFTTTGCELAVLRRAEDGKVEILLHRRKADDKFYANQWHTSGSLFYGHEAPESVFRRLNERELAGARISEPLKIGGNYFQTPRGPEVTLLHVSWLEGEYTGTGAWFRFDALPADIIDHHHELLRQVREWVEVNS